jgi:short-subunit dehydrogenase
MMKNISAPQFGTPATIITGATEGIGRALAEEFAKAGHTLLLVSRDAAKLSRTADDISRRHSVVVKTAAQDLTTVLGCDGVEQALRRFDFYADILVNNAGVMRSGFLQDQKPETIRRLIDLNVRATVDLTLRLLPGMVARGRGGILNVSSMMGYMPVPYQSTYAASKAFILSFSKALAYETMGTGVRVSVFAPGVVATDLHRKAGAHNSRYLLFFPAWTAERAANLAYRRFMRGWSVIIPGIINPVSAFLTRFVPDFMLVPLMGWFFRMRDDEGRVLWPGGALEPEQRRSREREATRLTTVD